MLKESIGLSIGAINSKQLNALIMQDWNGKNWSERIWTDRDKLGACVKNVLEKGITQGIGYRKLARELKENVKTSFNNAFRLIRTESAFRERLIKPLIRRLLTNSAWRNMPMMLF